MFLSGKGRIGYTPVLKEDPLMTNEELVRAALEKVGGKSNVLNRNQLYDPSAGAR